MARDYFAEMYVAGILADKGWNIYFPRRDQGFDFIITKSVGSLIIVRPVQVKGKFPEVAGRNLPKYGFVGSLSQVHEDMVLAIPYFSNDIESASPDHVAYMPVAEIRTAANGNNYCLPARVINGMIEPRPKFVKYFNSAGINFMEQSDWR